MLGIVDAGGGLRGIYGAGVLDCFLSNGVHFDCHIGVSTGALNLVAFIGGQRLLAYRVYTEFPFQLDNMSLYQWLRTGDYIDWAAFDHTYAAALAGNAEIAAEKRLTICTTEAVSGKADYLTGDKLRENLMNAIKASACPPIASRPCFIDAVPYFSGSLSDPIPVARAFSEECDQVVLILGFPISERIGCKPPGWLIDRIGDQYPGARAAARKFSDTYRNCLKSAIAYKRERRLYIFAPRESYSLRGYYSKKLLPMKLLYSDGQRDAHAILDRLKQRSKLEE